MTNNDSGLTASADRKRFKTLMAGSLALVLLVLASNSFLEAYITGARERVRRQAHFEQVIQKKGLDLHKGMYWKEKE